MISEDTARHLLRTYEKFTRAGEALRHPQGEVAILTEAAEDYVYWRHEHQKAIGEAEQEYSGILR